MRSQAARQASSDACAPGKYTCPLAPPPMRRKRLSRRGQIYRTRGKVGRQPTSRRRARLGPAPTARGRPEPGPHTRETTHVQTRIARRPVPSRAGRRSRCRSSVPSTPTMRCWARRLPRHLPVGRRRRRSLGLPDLGINTMDDVLTDVRRITDVCDVPLLVDIDTGFGPSAFNIARTVKSLIKFGAAPATSRTGRRQALRATVRRGNRQHRGNGRPREGRRRCRTDSDFYLIARTDAIACTAWTPPSRAGCVEAGAERHLRRKPPTICHRPLRQGGESAGAGQHHRIRQDPLFFVRRNSRAWAWAWLYPLSAFRAMNKAAEAVSPPSAAMAAEERGRPDADARRAVRPHRLSRIRIEAGRPVPEEQGLVRTVYGSRRGGDPPRPPVPLH